jgi:ribosomal protein S18 acetylase RimI-like enzyme
MARNASEPYNAPMSLSFRPADPADVDDAVPLIYSSGPSAFDYVFGVPGGISALEFLRRAFVDGAGEFGYRNHVVGVDHGVCVAIGAVWSGASSLAFMLAAVRQILSCYGPLAGASAMARGLRIETVIPPPPRACCYVGHLAVQPQVRSRGAGEALTRHLLAQGQARGWTTAALDVALTNPRAQALYERIGFVVTRERTSRLANAMAAVPNHRRMELRFA